jgi:hypothetical protein
VDFVQNKVGKKQRDNTNCVLLRSDESGISNQHQCMDKIVSSISLNSPVTGAEGA